MQSQPGTLITTPFVNSQGPKVTRRAPTKRKLPLLPLSGTALNKGATSNVPEPNITSSGRTIRPAYKVRQRIEDEGEKQTEKTLQKEKSEMKQLWSQYEQMGTD